jgi:hypothetical protein
VKEIIKKNLYEKFDEDFDEILYFLEGVDSHIFADSYGSYFYDGNFIGNNTANGLREIIDNMFEHIKDEDLELIAKELKKFNRIPRKLLPYVDFVERNGIETVWLIHIYEEFVLGSKDPDCADPDGIEEILEKLEALIDAIEKYRA